MYGSAIIDGLIHTDSEGQDRCDQVAELQAFNTTHFIVFAYSEAQRLLLTVHRWLPRSRPRRPARLHLRGQKNGQSRIARAATVIADS